MSRKPATPLFLQRAGYRQRRLRDAVRFVPFVGLVLLAIPLAWGQGDSDADVGSAGLLYVFGVWVLLILLSAVLSSLMHADKSPDTLEGPEE